MESRQRLELLSLTQKAKPLESVGNVAFLIAIDDVENAGRCIVAGGLEPGDHGRADIKSARL